jgi:L-ascorbate metabolism protein UlaG (beta-lactamase superfamily)
MGERRYLKANVVAEPLVRRWYAWTYIVSPMTAPFYVARSHLRILQSFVAAPQVHVSALKNPAMAGGPFIRHGAERVGEVRALLERTTRELAHQIAFVEAWEALERLLAAEGTGFSLEPLYAQVPEPLRGYVELTYDLRNRPAARLLEGLLYRGSFYDSAGQQVRLSAMGDDNRPFVFSTPRLERDDRLCLDLPFADPRLDALIAMKRTPADPATVAADLGLDLEAQGAFAELLTDELPPPVGEWREEPVRVRYFGHACLLVEAWCKGEPVRILVDPVIAQPTGSAPARYTVADLPETIDWVLITHNHQDHCLLETLLELRPRIRSLVVPKSGGGPAEPSLKLLFQRLGFADVRELDELESLAIPGGAITGLPFLGEHGDLAIRTKLAFHIALKGQSLLVAADSNNIEPRLYARLAELLGPLDALFLGMECEGAPVSWVYGPLLPASHSRKMDQSRRLDGSNAERAEALVETLRPRAVYVYAMGQEPWLGFLTALHYTETSRPIVESNRLVATCRERGRHAERLYGRAEIFLGEGV